MNDKINEILDKLFFQGWGWHKATLDPRNRFDEREKRDEAVDEATTQIRQAVLAEALACVGEELSVENLTTSVLRDARMSENRLKRQIRKQLNATFGGE